MSSPRARAQAGPLGAVLFHGIVEGTVKPDRLPPDLRRAAEAYRREVYQQVTVQLPHARERADGAERNLPPPFGPAAPIRLASRSAVRYSTTVRAKDVAAFAGRDWAAIAAAKDAQWLTERRRRGTAWCVAVADDLRRQVQRQHPTWPTPEERQADLDTHVRVGSALRRVRRTGHH
jgi:hypothetical protein